MQKFHTMKRALVLTLVILFASFHILAQDTLVKVHIMSSPDRAKLYIDGQRMGRTPASFELSSGEHQIKAIYRNRTAEKQLFLPDSTSSGGNPFQQFVFLECNKGFGGYITSGSFLVMGGIETDDDDVWPCISIGYMKKFGGFIRLYHYSKSDYHPNYHITSIDGIITGPLIHLYGPICFEAGIGFQTKEYGFQYSKTFAYIIGASVVFNGFALSIDYNYKKHEKYHSGIDISIGWAF